MNVLVVIWVTWVVVCILVSVVVVLRERDDR